jgi:hypothetical protein
MMRLVRDEQDMLEGKEGLAKQKAMELLVKYAEGLGADRFVDTNNVTIIVGCFMDTTAALIILVPNFCAYCKPVWDPPSPLRVGLLPESDHRVGYTSSGLMPFRGLWD